VGRCTERVCGPDEPRGLVRVVGGEGEPGERERDGFLVAERVEGLRGVLIRRAELRVSVRAPDGSVVRGTKKLTLRR
jgi:hypothetical protein